MFEGLDGTTRELQGFLKEFRANPKKFLTITRQVLVVRTELVVNADDFGFTRDVNAGIVEAHRNGILTATTLMATGDAFDDAVRLAKETPSLDIGCHLVLVGAPGFPLTIPQLVRAVALGRIRIYDELVQQVRRIVDAGLSPTHLDTHKHTHLLPPVLEAVARISEEFRIPWVRRPFDFPLQPGGVGWKNTADAADERAFPLRAHASSLPFDGLVCGIPTHRQLSAATI